MLGGFRGKFFIPLSLYLYGYVIVDDIVQCAFF